jgi:hypothetical protein
MIDAKQARNADLASVCESYGLTRDKADKAQFIGIGHRITINNYAWFDHSAGIGGGGAIDLAMHLYRCNYAQALNVLNMSNVTATQRQPMPVKAYQQPPKIAPENLPTVINYLTTKRGINRVIVDWCINRGMIYADYHKNCVFRYGAGACEMRGTGAVQWRSSRGEFKTGFFVPAREALGVALCESTIDALSYRQLHPRHCVMSLGGNSNAHIMQSALDYAIKQRIELISAFDNDKGGAVADTALIELARRSGVYVVQKRSTLGKDWNEHLLNC